MRANAQQKTKDTQELEKEISELKRFNSKLIEERREAKEQCAQLEIENAALLRRFSEAEKKLEATLREKSWLQIARDEATNAINELQKLIQELQQQLIEANAENEKLKIKPTTAEIGIQATPNEPDWTVGFFDQQIFLRNQRNAMEKLKLEIEKLTAENEHLIDILRLNPELKAVRGESKLNSPLLQPAQTATAMADEWAKRAHGAKPFHPTQSNHSNGMRHN